MRCHTCLKDQSYTLISEKMKNIRLYIMSMLVLLTLTLSSCEAIGDIFKAGAYTAIIVIVIVVILIIWLLRKLGGRRGPRV